LGEDSKGVDASNIISEDNWLRTTHEAHHVGISPQEDRYGTAGAVGTGEGGEEGGIGLR
jgi:hypothetical protein